MSDKQTIRELAALFDKADKQVDRIESDLRIAKEHRLECREKLLEATKRYPEEWEE